MSFGEALVRAKAAHVPTKTVYQPGNGYREEHICKCGAFVFTPDWRQHVQAAADQLLSEHPGPPPHPDPDARADPK